MLNNLNLAIRRQSRSILRSRSGNGWRDIGSLPKTGEHDIGELLATDFAARHLDELRRQVVTQAPAAPTESH